MMPLVWIFGGTSEGRCLAQAALSLPIRLRLSVATDYGSDLAPRGENLEIWQRRLTAAEMTACLQADRPELVIDATHPYATAVTENIRAACAAAGTPYIRLVRSSEETDTAITVSSMAEAVEFLSQTEGPIFLTTGSKDLDTFATLPDYASRIALRILPALESLEKALRLGYERSRIVCMQGPFTIDLNAAMFRFYEAAWVVTKESGQRGGFEEKAAAAQKAGAHLLVVSRKDDEQGPAYDDVWRLLEERYGQG